MNNLSKNPIAGGAKWSTQANLSPQHTHSQHVSPNPTTPFTGLGTVRLSLTEAENPSASQTSECACSSECESCHGEGVVLLATAGEIIAATCSPCGGTGTYSEDCTACRKPEVIPSASVRVEGKTVYLDTAGQPFMQIPVTDRLALQDIRESCLELGHCGAANSLYRLLLATREGVR